MEERFDVWIDHLENLNHPYSKTKEILEIVKYFKLKLEDNVFLDAVGTEECKVTYTATYCR